jgi:predicted nucleotidyltransferase
MEQMKGTICRKLDEAERAENVRVLYAAESGSRAWGFASPDSDYDVRFIYAAPPDEYLRLDERRDAIEYELDEVFDINGWDIQKALQLFRKSNPTLFEWLGSPIVYRTTDIFENIRGLLGEYYQKKHGLYHYHSMAKKNFLNNFKEDRVRLKKYFYVIRPLLACKWILQNDGPPPVAFSDLADGALEERLRPEMENLLARKKAANESETQTRLAVWDRWIQDNLSNIENALRVAPADEKVSWDGLNTAFREIVRGS